MARKRNPKSQNKNQRANAPIEPHWAPLARQQFTLTQTLSIYARHLIPLAMLAFFGGSVLQFLLLCVFNLGFTIAGIATIGAGVSTRAEVGDRGWADFIAFLVTMAVICTGVSLMFCFLFGWVIAVVASGEDQGLWDKTLWWSVLATVACALPGLIDQFRTDLRSGLSETARKERDQPVIGVYLFSGVALFALSAFTLEMDGAGAITMALAITALFITRDLRPDLARELTRPSHRPPSKD